ncbi:hypothetical protein Ami103574_06925 [Aminipila butyrica]|uniref:ABC-2 family transporter protein n=1 Tax=Aminipila butyrica TaxID=433296 RepID=A0A858BV51_9FIRM|nr:hypothetical protein [Aminipila butyrica]QIB69069.1 hypothetical protein Ami103574_06925 [Aminipila butyrica]
MNGKFRKELQTAFDISYPSDKERFLEQLRYPKITYQEFLFEQLRYIRKRIWMASVLIILFGWIITFRLPAFQYWRADGIKIWNISAILPFLAMITITEIYRSVAYNMAELEESCRFSLSQIIMARMSILGGVNFVILILLLIFMNQVSSWRLLQIISYSMTPYLLVCAICLWLLNRMHGSDGMYACGAATGFVSVSNILIQISAVSLYSDTYLNGWLTIFAGSVVLIGFQIRKLVGQLEEKQWNLNLAE